MKPDVGIWAAEYAEGAGVDSRCINFLLKHPEIIEGSTINKDGEVLVKGNLRLWTMFFDSIKGISDFSKEIGLVMDMGSGSIPEEHILQFANFIKNGLDKLPSPHELLTMTQSQIITSLKTNIRENENKRQDIAGIITKRLLNYIMVNIDSITPQMIDNYANIIESGYLSSDLVLISLRKVAVLPKFKDFTKKPSIIKILVS